LGIILEWTGRNILGIEEFFYEARRAGIFFNFFLGTGFYFFFGKIPKETQIVQDFLCKKKRKTNPEKIH